VRRTLDELPKSLDETYERVLREIKKPNMDNALRLLQCLVVATRPLRVEELAEVLAVDFDVGEEIPTLNTGWRWEDQEQALLSSCSCLISIVHGNGGDNEVDEDDKDNGDNQNENDSNDHNHDNALVQFSHFSVKEFLTSHRLATPIRDVSRYYIGLEPAHTIMAQACLSILLRSDLRIDHDGIRNNSPLTKYAAAHWVTHAQFKNVSSYLRQPMEILFDQDRPYFAAWLELHDIDSAPHSGSDTTFYQFTPNQISPACPLYYAALCGFQDIVEHLVVKDPQQVNTCGGYYVTAAIAALARKHFQLAQLLHRYGSSVDPSGFLGRTPLHSVAYYGDLEMMRILVEYKVNINAQYSTGSTPLYEGVSEPHLEAVRFLLEHGADPNIALSSGKAPLHRASETGNSEAVRLLLDHGVDVGAVDQSGKTAFQLALANGHDEIVTLLSARGTDDSS